MPNKKLASSNMLMQDEDIQMFGETDSNKKKHSEEDEEMRYFTPITGEQTLYQ